eukprot:scaffold26237_cov27-Tisochrysis_lutea.AAC.1
MGYTGLMQPTRSGSSCALVLWRVKGNLNCAAANTQQKQISSSDERTTHPSFGVEGDDVLHDVWVGVPVQSLEVVGSHQPQHVSLWGVSCKG